MKDSVTMTRTLLPLGFFGALMLFLVLSEALGPTQATTVVTNGDETIVKQIPEPEQALPRCKDSADCPLPTSYCQDSYCILLQNPFCDCSSPQVLRCKEESGRARFLYCKHACVQTAQGAICQ